MIIKSHIRGGYRAAADYLKEVGKNESIRLVRISDPDAANLDQAFHNMWTVASTSKCKKPLHHISINPMKDERLTDKQVVQIIERAEQKYGYKPGEHQWVVVEHVLNGRQHFHVIWNRVSLATGKAAWPGHHWKKSKQVCREMEKELGLKRPEAKRTKRAFAPAAKDGALVPVRNFQLVTPLRPGRQLSSERSAFIAPGRATTNISGMCEAQRIDFLAAREGKITWRQYFEKWGDNGPSL